MTGFMLELIQPSQVTTADTISSWAMQCMQKPDSRLTTKNGSQHTMNTPITMPSVLAAFFSLANLASLRDSEKFLPMCSVNVHLNGGMASSRAARHQTIAGKLIALEQIQTAAISATAFRRVIFIG
uniref:Uncharacterized protein n=1 Tax=Anopheles atroparvus TaxID=41427 RepID=A0A182J771_ANOAO